MIRQSKHIGCKQGGFLYGDVVIGATIVLILLPVILQVFWLATQQLETSYYRDRIGQDVVAFIEEGKATYDAGQQPIVGIAKSHFNQVSLEYVLKEEVTEVNGFPMSRYTVQAMESGIPIYELSTYLGPPLE